MTGRLRAAINEVEFAMAQETERRVRATEILDAYFGLTNGNGASQVDKLVHEMGTEAFSTEGLERLAVLQMEHHTRQLSAPPVDLITEEDLHS